MMKSSAYLGIELVNNSKLEEDHVQTGMLIGSTYKSRN